MSLIRLISIAGLIVQLCASGAHAKSESRRLHFAVGDYNARKVVAVLAMTCSDKNWSEFAAWAKQSHFVDWKVHKAIDMTMTENKISINSSHTAIEIAESGELTAKINGAVLHASDACALINQTRKLSAQTASTLIRWALPTANAENLVDESYLAEGVQIGVAVGAVALTVAFLPAEGVVAPLIALGFAVWSLYDIATASDAALTKSELTAALNSKFTLQCNEFATVLTYKNGSITVRKAGGIATIEVHPTNAVKDKLIGDSSAAPKSQKKLLELAQKCNNQDDAKLLMEQIGKIHDRVEEKVAAVETKSADPAADSKPGVVN